MNGPGRVLVTGGAGFIGSHLCEALVARGSTFAVVDSFDDFYPGSVKQVNLDEIARRGEVRLYETDIRNAAGLRKAFQEFKPEEIGRASCRERV